MTSKEITLFVLCWWLEAVRLRNCRDKALDRYYQKNKKSAKTKDLVGCPIEDLWKRLASQFRPGMTPENYGSVWHVDHKRPCASFDFSNPEHQRQCFHYSNLQPLFIEENRAKRDKWSPGG